MAKQPPWRWRRKSEKPTDAGDASERLLIILIITAVVVAVGFFELLNISHKLGYVPRSVPGPMAYK